MLWSFARDGRKVSMLLRCWETNTRHLLEHNILNHVENLVVSSGASAQEIDLEVREIYGASPFLP